jgi:hypothetical protein
VLGQQRPSDLAWLSLEATAIVGQMYDPAAGCRT